MTITFTDPLIMRAYEYGDPLGYSPPPLTVDMETGHIEGWPLDRPGKFWSGDVDACVLVRAFRDEDGWIHVDATGHILNYIPTAKYAP